MTYGCGRFLIATTSETFLSRIIFFVDLIALNNVMTCKTYVSIIAKLWTLYVKLFF